MSPPIKVRLLQRLRFDGFIWAKGLVVALPSSRASQLVRIGVAEYSEPGRDKPQGQVRKSSEVIETGVQT